MSNSELAAHVLLQLLVILAVCQVVGALATRLGQPRVVGEMIAGVLLGPSLLGLLLPEWKEFLFPTGPSMTILAALSHLGLVLFMFLVGLEFDTELIRHKVRSAFAISAAGILTPLALGSVTALVFLAEPGRYFSPDVVPWQAMLFIGSAVSITAFPMLARIIVERGLAGTRLGTLALACAATDDGVCWCLFAIVLATFSGDPALAVVAVAGGLIYVVATLTAGRNLLRRFSSVTRRPGGFGPRNLVQVLILLLAAAWLTDEIGIYAIFGAFILGAAMPRGDFREAVRERVGPLTISLLLPLFFVYSGLNTQIGLVNSPYLWAMTLLVVVVAILGKGVACYVAARLSGEPHGEAFALGSLMNARGLMELILLNIGLQAGLITPTLFTIFVLMAVVTTLMATPLFEFALRRQRAAGRTHGYENTAPAVEPAKGRA
ncbi:MAG: cation:proton antiporter [Pseudonocardia sp.]